MAATPHELAYLFDHSALLVALFDGCDRLVYANPAFREGYAIAADAFPTWSEMLRANYVGGVGAAIQTNDFEAWLLSAKTRRGKVPYRAFEADLCDGRWILVTETLLPDGAMLVSASDVTAIRDQERTQRIDWEAAKRAALTDSLTGAGNRRFIMEKLEEMVTCAKSSKNPGCLAVLDIDHFKSVNDRYGHLAGDNVLRDFVSHAYAVIRRSDCFGRIGGEEFMLLLPNTSVAQAQNVLERIIRRVRAARPLEDTGFRYTVSAGLAERQYGQSATELFAAADKALYAAKNGGRNRIEHLRAA
jgi:diguanylate cyclase (GGDEF)-like protein